MPTMKKINGKSEFLKKRIMADETTFYDSTEPIPDPVSEEPTVPVYDPTPVLDTVNECSNNVTNQVGTNVVQSVEGVVAQLISEDGTILKTFGLENENVRKQIRQDLINEKKLKLDMSGIESGQLVDVVICDYLKQEGCVQDDKTAIDTSRYGDADNLFRGGTKFEIQADMTLTPEKDRRHNSLILMDVNERNRSDNDNISSYLDKISTLEQRCVTDEIGNVTCKEIDEIPNDPSPSAEPAEPVCDYNHSPLLIDINGDGVSLAAPLDGVIFDIKGDGDKLLISWPNKSDDLLLTLPKQGKVESVNELFGNNTLGPDFKKAANGFEALKKYDVNNDGLINRKDPIFVKLRLWKDSNMDGISTYSELLQLSLFGITAIDLNYVNMYELDKFHNETKQRSVAVQKIGSQESLLMVFDVWFRGVSPDVLGF
jgi:hypothetical protein